MSEQRLSVTFGAFSCDVVGYNDPFSILNRVVELFGEIAKANPAFGAGEVGMSDMERAKLAAGLSDQASRIEELADNSTPNGLRYIVSNAEADMLDAPVADTELDDLEEFVADDEVVIAAEADEASTGGDLELRDTLEAVDAPAPPTEEEVVALAIDPTAADEAPAPLEETTAPTIEAPAEDTQANEIRADAEDASVNVAAAEEVGQEAESAEAQRETLHIDTPVAEIAAPEEAPLRLNIGNKGLERAAEEPIEETVNATEPKDEREKPQRRVTVTKLPLRPEPKAAPEQTAAEPKHTLSPVQKVEPVVTLNTTISAIEEEAPRPTRAERIKAKMEQREADDDSENFLFADVADTSPEGGVEHAEVQEEAEAPMTLTPAPNVAEVSAPQEEETAKKPRRSLVSLLGFGKKSEPAREFKPAAEVEIPAVEDIANELADNEPTVSKPGGVDGFDRLRESVAAAMPATEEPLTVASQAVAEPQSISEAIDYDDESSPTTFARRVGATTLQDLLEASAVYMNIVEGKSRFSRRDVMQALHQIDADKDYSQEARLKSFRKLLTTGSLVRVDDGMFTVSQATRYGYESQLQAS